MGGRRKKPIGGVRWEGGYRELDWAHGFPVKKREVLSLTRREGVPHLAEALRLGSSEGGKDSRRKSRS